MSLKFQQITQLYYRHLQTIRCVKTCHPAAHLGKLRVSSPEVGHPPLEPKAFWSFAVPIHWSIMVDHGQLPSLSPNNSSYYSCSIQESTSVPVG